MWKKSLKKDILKISLLNMSNCKKKKKKPKNAVMMFTATINSQGTHLKSG